MCNKGTSSLLVASPGSPNALCSKFTVPPSMMFLFYPMVTARSWTEILLHLLKKKLICMVKKDLHSATEDQSRRCDIK